ncbi:MAG TPA: right-handed parallel beta-helix repeat-containing protein [Flavobacteriales bacterium]|nr:right-handed parallel beta-helix repeat-containing protein [Flavobacteriales bacterium]
MRKGKRSRPSAQAWFFALAMPAVALFMLFSLLPYQTMVGNWPLGIKTDEVMAFQELFDHRPGQHAEGHAEVLRLADEGEGHARLQAEGREGTGKLIAVGTNERIIGLVFPEEHPFDGAVALVLVPADLASLDALYAQAVADSLPIMAPAVKVVKLERDGRKAEPYLLQERITPAYLLQHAPVAMDLIGEADGASNYGGRFRSSATDSIGRPGKGSITASHFDTSATKALGLLACATRRTDLLSGNSGAMQDAVTRNIVPVFAMRDASVTVPGEALAGAFREALADAAVQRRILRLGGQLRADSAAWAQCLIAIDTAVVPVLAKGRNLGLVQAEVDRRREQFLQRLFHPDVQEFLGSAEEQPRHATPTLDPWLAQFRTNPDTLRFVRGKYDIDHDLVLPSGMAVVLERGARWFMAPGVSVVVNGELHMRGTELNPVFIRPQDESAPWGSIAVNGKGRTRVRINGLRISGGGNLWCEGVHHGGMLSFIGADVRMTNCAFAEAFGDAVIHGARGTFHLADSYFMEAHHDFIDLAEAEGTIERCGFGQPAAAPLATGRNAVNMRASDMLVRNCTFADLPFTALRVARSGEATVQGGRFSGNKVAIAALDGSAVQVKGCEFSGNGTVFVLRRERPVLGGATLKEEGNTFTGNAVLKEVDAASKLGQDGTGGAAQ